MFLAVALITLLVGQNKNKNLIKERFINDFVGLVTEYDTFKEFNNQQLVKESYDLLEGSVSYDDLNDILNEGLFSFIKGIFINTKY